MLCKKCGKEIAEGQEYCDNCVETVSATDSNERICPHCGKETPKSERFCVHCDGFIGDEKTEQVPSKKQTGTINSSQPRCPHCEKLISVNDRFCPHCDGLIKVYRQPQIAKGGAKACKNCYSIIPSETVWCPNCGKFANASELDRVKQGFVDRGSYWGGFFLVFFLGLIGLIIALCINKEETKRGALHSFIITIFLAIIIGGIACSVIMDKLDEMEKAAGWLNPAAFLLKI